MFGCFSWFSGFGLLVGAEVVSTKPLKVSLLAGDLGTDPPEKLSLKETIWSQPGPRNVERFHVGREGTKRNICKKITKAHTQTLHAGCGFEIRFKVHVKHGVAQLNETCSGVNAR